MTPERIEQERKAFEEWYASTYLPTPMHGRTFNKYPTGVFAYNTFKMHGRHGKPEPHNPNG